MLPLRFEGDVPSQAFRFEADIPQMALDMAKQYLKENKKMMAIKVIKDSAKVSLQEARQFVDSLQEKGF